MCLSILHHLKPCNNTCQQEYKILHPNNKQELKTKWTENIYKIS